MKSADGTTRGYDPPPPPPIKDGGQGSTPRTVVMIRNGHAICAHCRDLNCMTHTTEPDVEFEHISDELCECCAQDVEGDDGFGI